MGARSFDLVALVCVPIGTAKAAGGLVALVAIAASPAVELGVHPDGVPRWVPHVLSLVLAVCALITWRTPRAQTLVLASIWAIAAGAFARPALLVLGWWCPPLEWALAPLILAAGAMAIQPRTHPEVRIALGGAAVAAFAVGVALMAPKTATSAATTYGLIIAAAVLSASVAYRLRRPLP